MIMDSFGREIKQFSNDCQIVIQKAELFEDWIDRRFGSYGDFLSLKPHEKRKVFLRYKWGFNDNQLNEDLESSEQHILFLIGDRKFKTEDEIYYWQKVRDWKQYCSEVYAMIGLGKKKEDKNIG